MDKPTVSEKMDKYEIDSCIDTLLRAEEIKADKKKMKQIMPKLEMKKRAIMSMEDLISAKDEVDAEDEGDEE